MPTLPEYQFNKKKRQDDLEKENESVGALDPELEDIEEEYIDEDPEETEEEDELDDDSEDDREDEPERNDKKDDEERDSEPKEDQPEEPKEEPSDEPPEGREHPTNNEPGENTPGQGGEATEAAEAGEGAGAEAGATAEEAAAAVEEAEAAEAAAVAAEGAEVATAAAEVGALVAEEVATDSTGILLVVKIILAGIALFVVMLIVVFMVISSSFLGGNSFPDLFSIPGFGSGGTPPPTGTTPPPSSPGGFTPPSDILDYCKYQGPPTQTQKMSLYGSSESAVRAQLVWVDFPVKKTGRILVHKKAAPCFDAVAKDFAATGLLNKYPLFKDGFVNGGTFCWRCQNNSTCGWGSTCGSSYCPCGRLSNHSWAIALDLNVSTNPYKCGASHTLTEEIADVFRKYGFKWGGDYCDYMHFEWFGRA